MSKVRDWIAWKIKESLPVAPMLVWSDTNAKQFTDLTATTHKELLDFWDGPIDEKTKLRAGPGKGPKPTLTTCTSFLPVFASFVRLAGGIVVQKHDYSLNKDVWVDPLRPFEMFKNKAWRAYPKDGWPKAGDFFALGALTNPHHVGVIMDIDTNAQKWTKVAGGAGGRLMGHDAVKRTDWEPIDHDFAGWLDVDVYFDGWVPADSIYDEFE